MQCLYYYYYYYYGSGRIALILVELQLGLKKVMVELHSGIKQIVVELHNSKKVFQQKYHAFEGVKVCKTLISLPTCRLWINDEDTFLCVNANKYL